MNKIAKSLLALALFVAPAIPSASAQTTNMDDQVGRISLVPFVENASGAKQSKADKILLDKLQRIVLANGMVDTNLGGRFIITAHPVILDEETTNTTPPKVVTRLTLTFYIGDAQDGKLFGSYSIELKGLGADADAALASAYRKMRPESDPGFRAMIDESKEKIVKYYDANAPALMSQAESAARAGNWEECYSILLSIPQACGYYDKAMDLLVKYHGAQVDNANNSLLDKARAAWSASPNEEGAKEARQYLDQMDNVTPEIRSKASALSKEISTRLKNNEDWERREQAKQAQFERSMEARRANQEHAERMASIRGATAVAVAQAKRPIIHNHWHWW